MLAEFSLTPIGTKGEHLSGYLAPMVPELERSGLRYELHAMGTLLEGNWDEILSCIRRCATAVMGGHKLQRLSVQVKIDFWSTTQKPGEIERKVQSLHDAVSALSTPRK